MSQKRTFILTLGLLILGCRQKPEETFHKGEFRLEYLFEHKGCKMYRFQDGGARWVYGYTGLIAPVRCRPIGRITVRAVHYTRKKV